MEAHRHRVEREGRIKELPAPESKGHGMARQCPRGHDHWKSREDADITSTVSADSTATQGR
jgi:hypothetical protein